MKESNYKKLTATEADYEIMFYGDHGFVSRLITEDDFRSINGQIEYLLTECVRQRKKKGKYVSDEIDVPPEFDIK